MSISFKAALGIHDQALMLRSRRTEILATNLAQADTPNYKARDIDFRAALAGSASQARSGLRATHAGHIQTDSGILGGELLYRVPDHASLDGNTVDSRVEHAKFSENAVRYQATLTFLGGKFNTLTRAIKGE